MMLRRLAHASQARTEICLYAIKSGSRRTVSRHIGQLKEFFVHSRGSRHLRRRRVRGRTTARQFITHAKIFFLASPTTKLLLKLEEGPCSANGVSKNGGGNVEREVAGGVKVEVVP